MAIDSKLFKTKSLTSTSALKNKSRFKKKSFSLDEREVKNALSEMPGFPKPKHDCKGVIAPIMVTPDSFIPLVKPKKEKKKKRLPLMEVSASNEFKMLRPIEQRIINFIKGRIDEKSNSDFILIDNKALLEAIEISASALRNALSHMRTNKIISISKTRNGPSGWRLFEIKGLLK